MGLFDFLKHPNPDSVVADMVAACMGYEVERDICSYVSRWLFSKHLSGSSHCDYEDEVRRVFPYVVAAGLSHVKQLSKFDHPRKRNILKSPCPDLIGNTVDKLHAQRFWIGRDFRGLYKSACSFALNVSHMMPPGIDRALRNAAVSSECDRMTESICEWLRQMIEQDKDIGEYEYREGQCPLSDGPAYLRSLIYSVARKVDEVLRHHYTQDFNWGGVGIDL